MKIELGLYRHYKGDNVEVVAVARVEKEPERTVVVYKHGNKTWVRRDNDFLARVKNVNGVEVPRFEHLRAYGSQRQLFAQTMRENRIFWFKGLEQNPAMKVNGEGTYFKFCLGDKISFALSVRIISKNEAKVLIEWVRKWSTKDDRLFDARGEEWEKHCGSTVRKQLPSGSGSVDDSKK